LQVEHPVTEMVTGLDLVALQLHVAMGGTLPPDVMDARSSGHAIEARLYAEDVAAGFLPSSGTLGRFRWDDLPHVRVDAGYTEGCVVGTHYDAMLAKVIAWAPTRPAAAARLAHALRTMEISGVTTNRALLVHTLEQQEFLDGRTDTGFFARHDPADLSVPLVSGDEEVTRLVAAAAAALAPRRSPVPAGIPVGWRNVGGAQQTVQLVTEDGRTVDVTCVYGRGGLDVSVGDGDLPGLKVRAVREDVVEIDVGGRRRVFQVVGGSGGWTVTDRIASSWFREVDRFPGGSGVNRSGSLDSPMPGAVTQLAVAVGDTVVEGQLVVAIEAMKMEHPIHAPHAGTVTDVLVAVADQVDTGQTLLVVAPQGEDGR
ncbi:MAG: biotin/lipoyl-containing protein, partial [Sciscionella sp.]